MFKEIIKREFTNVAKFSGICTTLGIVFGLIFKSKLVLFILLAFALLAATLKYRAYKILRAKLGGISDYEINDIITRSIPLDKQDPPRKYLCEDRIYDFASYSTFPISETNEIKLTTTTDPDNGRITGCDIIFLANSVLMGVITFPTHAARDNALDIILTGLAKRGTTPNIVPDDHPSAPAFAAKTQPDALPPADAPTLTAAERIPSPALTEVGEHIPLQ